MKLALALASLVLLTACSGQEPSVPPTEIKQEVSGSLTLTVRADAEAEPQTYNIDCELDDDFCLIVLEDTSLDPTPKDTNCTMQYGGPASAELVGTVNDTNFDLDFGQSNGCEIGRWRQLTRAVTNLEEPIALPTFDGGAGV